MHFGTRKEEQVSTTESCLHLTTVTIHSNLHSMDRRQNGRLLGRGCCEVVSVLAFYSDLKERKQMKKSSRMSHLKMHSHYEQVLPRLLIT